MITRTVFVISLLLLILGYFAVELFVIRSELAMFRSHPLQMRDFANYWIAAKAYFDNDVSAIFEQKRFIALLRAEFGPDYPWHNWSYPPHYLLFCLPLAAFGYFTALYGFLAITLVFFYLATRRYLGELFAGEEDAIWNHWLFGLLLVPIVVTDIRFAQNGFLTSGLFLLALAYWRRRPVLAGIFLGLLTIKPQLGLLVPLLLLFDRNWPAIASAIATTLAMIVASGLAFGFQSWIDYVSVTVPYQSRVLTEFGDGDLYLAMMMSAYSSVRTLGFSGNAPLVVHWIFAVPAVVLLLLCVKARPGHDVRFAALIIATFIASPYVFNYDAGILCVACAALAMRYRAQWLADGPAQMQPTPRGLLELRYRLLCLVCTLPILSHLLAALVAPVAPAILLVVLASLTPQVERLWRGMFSHSVHASAWSTVGGRR